MLIKNKHIIIVYIFLLFALLIKGDSIDRQLSQSIRRTEGRRESNFTVEAEALGEITADNVLRQELKLPPGVLQIGIRFGTYLRCNYSNYHIVLYDNENNVIAKRVVSAERLEDNQICYITLYGKTSGKVSYVLEISSPDAKNGNAITGYGIQARDGYSSCTFGGQDTGKEIVIELVMQQVFPLTFCLIVLLTVSLIIFLFRTKIWCALKIAGSLFALFWRKQKKIIICSNIVLSLFGLVAVFFIQTEEYDILSGSSISGNAEVRQYNGKITQRFQSAQDFEAIKVRLATYLQKYQQGKLFFALYGVDGEKFLEQEVAGKQIKDNELLRFDFEKIQVDGRTDFYFELWTEDFGEQELGIYYREDSEEIQYQLLQKKEVLSGYKMLLFILWGLLWMLLYLCACTKIKKEKKELITAWTISIFVGLLLSTYVNYCSFSLEALAKNMGMPGKGRIVKYNQKEVKNCTSRIYRYDAKGNVYCVFDQIVLEEIRTRADVVEIYLDKTDYLKKNTLAIYLDCGDGFNLRTDAEYEYVYKGQEKIVIPIKNSNHVERIMLSFSMINENGYSEESLNKGYKYYNIKEIVLNSEKIVWYKAWKALLAGIILVWIFFVWKKKKTEDVVREWLQSGKNREAKIFFGIAMLFGFVFSILLPTFQAPDEPVHAKWVFQSIGAGELYEELSEIVGKGVKGVLQNGTVTVDTDIYWKAFHKRLSSYNFSFKPKANILSYPGQVCGILTGILLHLPAGWILLLAEFGALFLYAMIGAITIKIVPIRKELFAMVLLMPIAMQQAGSFSYDSFNNAVAALTIAYLLYLALKKEGVGMRQLAAAVGMLLILLFIKKVYVVCGLLIFLIPLEKYHFNIFHWSLEFKSKKAKIGLLSAMGGGGCLCAITVFFILVKKGALTSMVDVIRYPKEFGRLIFDTLFAQRIAWLKQGSALFGWLDGIIQNWIIIVLVIGLVTAAIAKKDDFRGWNGKKYMVCIGCFLVGMVGIILSMASWSSSLLGTTGSMLNQMLLFPSIEGVQGRYFLPILVLIFLFPVAKWMQRLRKHIPVYLILILVTVTTVGYSIYMLLHRYWIA